MYCPDQLRSLLLNSLFLFVSILHHDLYWVIVFFRQVDDILGDIMNLESVDVKLDHDLSLIEPSFAAMSQTVSLCI